MDITANMVKELRDKTGAGMMDCKKALTATEGDMAKAIDWLREKGIAKAEKKASRIAAEGLADIAVSGDKAVVFEVNCETDFVAHGDKFAAFVAKIGAAIVASNAESNEAALEVAYNGKTIREFLLENVAVIGENITLRNVTVFHKTADQHFGVYKHMGGKIVTLTILNGGSDEAAKDVAMHACAMNPRYLAPADIPADVIAHERQVLQAEALNENAANPKPKPEQIIVKMVEGRLLKGLKENCLINQPFVKNPDQSVDEYVRSKGASIVSFNRLAMGEGIEKKVENFAEEVMSQIK
ncbi:MAG TPA: elongation factor Ts [Acholeplasmatales bacterium]|nr:translation elongation factor Ts [Bacillota bacterium]HAQ55797.1 elongation factor Ts [Acholeplasmatales bacterium]